MIKQPITDEIKAEAMKLAKEITNVSGNDNHNFGNDGINQNYIGFIGQLTLKSWLMEYNIHGKHHTYNTDGRSDDYDFMLEGSDKTIDVKTDPLRNISIDDVNITFINANQVDSKPMDYYIDMKLDRDLQYAYINGYIKRDDVINNYKSIQTEKMSSKAYPVKIRDFSDIRELIFKETGKCIDGYVKPTTHQLSMMDY